MKLYTLNYIVTPADNGKLDVILGEQKRGLWKGYFNGFGGKIEPNENLWQSAQRELKEETGLGFDMPEILHSGGGQILFEYPLNPILNCGVHVNIIEREHIACYTKNSIPPSIGYNIIENDEMRPHRFSIDKLPYSKMPPFDIYWLPQMLKNVATGGPHYKEKVFAKLSLTHRRKLERNNGDYLPHDIINSIHYSLPECMEINGERISWSATEE